MEEMIQGLVTKCGLSEEQAKTVYDYLVENGPQVTQWLSDSGMKDKIKDKLPGGLGGLF